MKDAAFRRLGNSFALSLTEFERLLEPVVKKLKKARKERGSDEDPVLLLEPTTVGSLVGGQRKVPGVISGLSEVGPEMAELNKVKIPHWPEHLKPEDMFSAQLFGATPMNGHRHFGEGSFHVAQEAGLFDLAFDAVSKVDPKAIVRPLNAAANVTAYFEGAIASMNTADKIRSLLAVFPYVFGSLTRLYCDKKPLRHTGTYAGSFAKEYVRSLGSLVSGPRQAGAIDFIDMYLVLLSTHGANFSEVAAFLRQTGDSKFNPIGDLRAGFDFLGADSHGGAQSLVEWMMANCRAFMGDDPSKWTYERLKEWATDVWETLIYGFGHAKYETGDPRGKRLRDYVAGDSSITDSVGYKFFLFFLEHAEKLLEETRPKVRNRIENVDFIAGFLQGEYLGITSPAALELLFGLARVPSYIRGGYLAHVLGVSIFRPDGVLLPQLAELLEVENPLDSETLFADAA